MPISIKSTFLGAHAFPIEYQKDHEGYISLLIDEMLPKIAEESSLITSMYFVKEIISRLMK